MSLSALLHVHSGCLVMKGCWASVVKASKLWNNLTAEMSQVNLLLLLDCVRKRKEIFLLQKLFISVTAVFFTSLPCVYSLLSPLSPPSVSLSL